jgi:4-amino-4-deoxy-L-arabinose transferase-like glycosyltransferase
MTTTVADTRPRRGDIMSRRLPMLLLGVLFLLLMVFVATQAGAYGHAYDEIYQDSYGTAILRWYTTGGHDQSFLHFQVELHMPEHGPFFETIVALAQQLFGHHWHTRAVVCGTAGVLGILGIALCGRELAGWWGGLVAALGLTLFPRYTGAIFNNSKDIPLTVAMIFVLWLSMRLFRRWRGARRRLLLDSALLGFAIGAAASIRATGLIWFGVLAMFLAGWWLRHSHRVRARRRTGAPADDTGVDGIGVWSAIGRQATAAAIIGVAAYLAMLLLWPYVALHPASGLIDSIHLMSRYDWDGDVLLDGTEFRGGQIPWRYAPEWLLIGSPPVTVLGALLGLGFLLADAVRRRLPDPGTLLAGALLVVPVGTVMLLHSTLYNGLRHFLFAIPGMILLATTGLIRLFTILRRQRSVALAGALGAVLLLAQGEVIVETVRLRPLEYMYLSPVVGGFSGAHDRYETDYWSTCETLAVRWLHPRVHRYTSLPNPTIAGLIYATQDADVAPPLHAQDDPHADFVVSGPDGLPPASRVVRDGYIRIYAVGIEGVSVCAVYLNQQAATA